MAVTADVVSKRVNLLLNNGTTDSGSIKTVSLSIGSLNASTYDRQKAVNIVNALGDCIDRSVYSVRETDVNELSED